MAAKIYPHLELKNWRRGFAAMLDAARAEADRKGVHDVEAVAVEMDKIVRKERAVYEQDQ